MKQPDLFSSDVLKEISDYNHVAVMLSPQSMSVDRFFDSYDLYKTSCWIQYTNVDKESFYFSAPMVVRGEKYGTDTILIPWLISKEVTKTSGTIQFSF